MLCHDCRNLAMNTPLDVDKSTVGSINYKNTYSHLLEPHICLFSFLWNTIYGHPCAMICYLFKKNTEHTLILIDEIGIFC